MTLRKQKQSSLKGRGKCKVRGMYKVPQEVLGDRDRCGKRVGGETRGETGKIAIRRVGTASKGGVGSGSVANRTLPGEPVCYRQQKPAMNPYRTGVCMSRDEE